MNYFEYSEEKDNRYLQRFNDLTHTWITLERNGHFNRIDFTADNEYAIELKTRNFPIDKYDTIFIEPDKYKALIDSNLIPIYINFFEDSDSLAIFNLHDIPDPKTIEPTIYNPGKKQYQKVVRYLLPLNKATKYKFNGQTYEIQG